MTEIATVKDRLSEYEMFDVAIMAHGFTPYMRDYDVLVEAGWQDAQGVYLYRFTHCPEASVRTRVRDESWHQAWADLFIDYKDFLAAGEPDGFVWGVCWSMAYPGLTYIDDSTLAAEWSKRFQKPMHEVTIETEAFHLQIVFHDIIIRKMSDKVDVIDRAIIPLKGP